MVSKQYEVPGVTYLSGVFRLALEISLFTGLWTGSNHLMCCNTVKVIVPMSICMVDLVERNVSSTHIKTEDSPCEMLSKPKCIMNLTFSESVFSSIFFYVEEYVR